MENDMGMEDIEGQGRTMIAGHAVPLAQAIKEGGTVYIEEAFELDADGKMPAVIEIHDAQYARLPEAWPAAGDKDLEEAHAEAVATDGEDKLDQEFLAIYATFTPEEVQELCEDWSRLVRENAALRKGMKTMQRKTRKQNQVQRRLERRLSQARAGREQLRATATLVAQRKIEDAAQALLDTLDQRGVVVRGGK